MNRSKMKTKVICVDTGRVPSLTLYKIYDGFIFEFGNTIQVVNDKNKVTTYKSKRFMRLDEFRENKLNYLGI